MASVAPLCHFVRRLLQAGTPALGRFFGNLGHSWRSGASGADNGEVNAWSAVSGRLASISAFVTLMICL